MIYEYVSLGYVIEISEITSVKFTHLDDHVTEIMTWFLSMLGQVSLGYVVELYEVTSVNLTH
jgi:hypothetical protein